MKMRDAKKGDRSKQHPTPPAHTPVVVETGKSGHRLENDRRPGCAGLNYLLKDQLLEGTSSLVRDLQSREEEYAIHQPVEEHVQLGVELKTLKRSSRPGVKTGGSPPPPRRKVTSSFGGLSERVKRLKEKLGWNNTSAQQTAVAKVAS